MKLRGRLAVPAGLLLVALVAGCGGDVVLPGEGEAANLEIVSGDEQFGQVGASLAEQVVVRVTDTRDRPVANQEVGFSIESGGGSIEPATMMTDDDGEAAASWTLGPNTGSHLLRVQTAGGGSGTLEVTFAATAVAGTGSVLVGVQGDDQVGPVNSALADSLVVRATDALGNPVANVEVTWTVSGGGSIGPVTVVTGTDGLAAAERVLGPTAGEHAAQATVAGFTGSPVTFSHTAVPANPTALIKVSGDGQSAPGGFEVAEDLVVRLEDANGNGIGGRDITWAVSVGSGSVNPVSTTTNPNGLATTRWTLPSAVGTYSVSAVFSGLDQVPFTGTATADVPTTIELASGDEQSASVGSALPNPLVVRVTDANGLPVANVGVTWTAEVGGSVSSPTSATNASGLASITRTLGALPGTYTTTAAVQGLSGSPITFTSTATVGPAAKLAIITQPGTTTATSGVALVPQPEIEVQDFLGNPILQANRTVSASIISSPESPTGPGSATLVGPNDQTDATGRTTYTGLRITGPAGPYVLRFSSGALIPVSSATITLGSGSATKLVLLQQPPSTAANGAILAPAPMVQVQDAAGTPISGNRNILVDIEDGSGVLSGTTSVNTSGGSTATFSNLRITGTAGDHSLLFSSTGLTSVESAAIAITAGPATSMDIAAGGDTQTAGVDEDVAIPPAVIVTDQSGNPVSGVIVSFDVVDGGGTVEPDAVATGSNGVAAVTTWTLGPAAGANQLEASATGLGSELFNATGVAANSPPTAVDDPDYSVGAGGTLSIADRATGVLGNDTDPDDPDGSELTVVNPTAIETLNGDLTLAPDGSFMYTPNDGFTGPDTFTYQASDGQDVSNTATVTITIGP